MKYFSINHYDNVWGISMYESDDPSRALEALQTGGSVLIIDEGAAKTIARELVNLLIK